MGVLYLIPNKLGDSLLSTVIPSGVLDIIKEIKVFATENPKNTRRFLKEIDREINIDALTFIDLNEHSDYKDVENALKCLKKEDVGIISEAGCPGIADPGASLVSRAHAAGYQVKPLVGPSSILMALIASGFSGQNFSFNGYLPINTNEKIKALRTFEKQSALENRTQIFIETPYRNIKLFQEMLKVLSPQTKLSIASDITSDNEFIKTFTIQEWRGKDIPNINKIPAVFCIYSGNTKI